MYLVLTLTVVAFVFSLVLTLVVRNLFRRAGVVDRPDRIRKWHTQAVPRVGGIAVAISYVAAFAVALVLPFQFRSMLVTLMPGLLRLLPAAALVFLAGLLDDLIGMKPWQKLTEQGLAALIAYWAGVQFHIMPEHAAQVWWNLPLTVLWLVGCSNAFNLIDGLDGLAAGAGLFGGLTMAAAALLEQDMGLVLVTMPLVGCLLGFLRYNFNPATVFLGDSGSLLIGFLLGCYGVLWSRESVTVLGLTAPLMAMAIPLLDAGLAVVRRFLRGQAIFAADRGHIHHRLLAQGLTPRRAALLMYAFCGVAAMMSLLQGAFHNEFGGLILVLFSLAAWIGIQHLGYVEFGVAREFLLKRAFRRVIDAQTKLREFDRALTAADSLEACWQTIQRSAQAFGFQGVRLNIQGRVFEAAPASRHDRHWQLRIALPRSQYLNFYQDLGSDVDPLVLGSFVKVVEERLKAKLEMLESEVLGSPAEQKPVASEAHPVARSTSA